MPGQPWSGLRTPRAARHEARYSVTRYPIAFGSPFNSEACDDRCMLAMIDGREQALEKAVDGLPIDPAHHGHDVVLLVDVDHVCPVTDMCKCGRRSARPALSVGVQEPVHVAVDRLGRGRRAGLINPALREQLTILPLAITQREIAEARHV